MFSKKSSDTSATLPSRQTVALLFTRVLAFLMTIARSPQIRGLLEKAGFTDEDAQQGWALLHRAGMKTNAPPTANPVGEAVAAIVAWRATALALVRPALVRLHPEQESFLFDGLDLVNAAASVLTVSVFLGRCQQLETGKDRKGTHKADVAALATLDKRGMTKAERKRMQALVDLVENQAAPAPTVLTEQEIAEQEANVVALRGWLTDWSSVAKLVVTRRDQLHALGIGRRKTAKAAAPARAVPATPPVVAPEAPAAPVTAPVSDDETPPQSRAA